MTHTRPAGDSPQIRAMKAVDHYRSLALHHHCVGNHHDTQTVAMSDGSTVVGWLELSPNGLWVECHTSDGEVARFDANRLEWFDASGNPYPTSNDKIADYYGTPVTAA